MPNLSIKEPADVPVYSPSPARSKLQREYDGFINALAAGKVGQLDLVGGEVERGVKVSLRRASRRVGANLRIWSDGGGRVFFAHETRRNGAA